MGYAEPSERGRSHFTAVDAGSVVARRYRRSAIRMLLCKISKHILDEILISGKVQIIVSDDYFTFGRNRLSKYIQH